MTVSDYFDLSKPDDYTILAWDGEGSEDFAMSAREESFQRNTGRSRWVAKPVVVKIGKPPTSDDVEHRPDSAHPGKSAGTSQCNDPTDKEWAELMRDAGRPHDQCFLDAIRSPLAPNAVHLVVSLFCLDLSHRSAGRETHMGVNPANYHILIRDNAGEFPPLTDFGREVFASRGREHLSFLWTGHANGAVFPLDELFSLKAGHDYTVLVSLPPEKLSDPGWVAPPVKIQVPELLATGVPRPRYGSEMMWAKLAVMTVTERTDPTLASTIEFGFSPYVAYLKMQLKGKAPTASHGDWRLADKTILVRDSRGKAVFPYKNGMTQKFVGWWTEAPAEIRIRQKSQSRQTATGLPEAREVWYPLSDVFPLRSGCRYTILSASNLTDDVQSVIVSKPMTFSMPVPFDRDGDSRTIGGSTSPNPLATTGTAEASFDSQWNEALRFAGKSFDGLSLEATSGRSIDLKVVLRNCSEKPVLVTKWKGESDFDLMVRRSNGNPVMMTDKGKKFFQSSCLLDVRKLNGHDTIDACLPITDLFDMRVSGDYTVLVTLPVVGDVDAVLTAKPLKVRVP